MAQVLRDPQVRRVLAELDEQIRREIQVCMRAGVLSR